MSKETGSFFRKVARFVTNPTTDWAALDNPPQDAAESEYAKTEIKAMIERKRRNDFVRKRELDMLRKIRREGLSQDAALAMSNPSNMDPDSRPQLNGPRSDIAVKAKIDEIELQMVGGGANRPPVSPTLPPAPTMPDALANAPTAPMPIHAHAATLPVELPPLDMDELPQVSGEILKSGHTSTTQATSAAPAPITSPLAPTGFQNDIDLHVTEVVHDPELDEAVIAFANADFDQCERCLLDLIQPGAARHDHSETWMVLFDFYRSLDLPQQFDQLAVSFAQKFGLSAPQWYSLPAKVAAFAASQELAKKSTKAVEESPAPYADASASVPEQPAVEGWVAPALIDAEAVAQLRMEILQRPRPWIMDWSNVQQVSPEGAAHLGQVVRQWAKEPMELAWTGTGHLMAILGDTSPTGSRDVDPTYWMLRLDILRLINNPMLFDEVAIDYCVTYELSPPSWEPAACKVREVNDAVNPHSRSLSIVSEVVTSFVESQFQNEVGFIQVAALNLSGQLIGDIGNTLAQLETQLGASICLEIDCQYLLRVDFIAAGDLLNWVLARRDEQRQVIFVNPHRLIALFFGAMGINEHAKVKLQLV
ncbi:MAG: hypothetical protein ACOYNB_08225 [Aquabacterium sp.]|uniref:STAS domain-containing protein n=1 Tax=Aquabacterium sp. TaxID=1872578 RepID=UPI003BCE2416